ncbi:MAG TPA: carboxylating nicotinate-nucleotide diphosphorylase [Glaciecola sp.]|nr:carboxylating nicotinate-nucleotide diphosphorylase [Glaciecola sp.]
MSNIDPSSPLASSHCPQHLASDTLIPMSIIQQDVEQALAEDLGVLSHQQSEIISEIASNDITAQLIPADTIVTANIICRDDAVISGIAWAEYAFKACDPTLQIQWQVKDGSTISPDTLLVTITGSARAILTAERVALNFLQTLSATATVTKSYVRMLEGSGITLLDTRKTLPKLRFAQKYAVQCGRGKNHRIGLYDAFLIKENHIFACGGIANAVAQAKVIAADTLIEVEVENLAELEQAINAGADVIMLDNFSTKQIHQAVAINAGKSKLEVSGNITDARIAELKDTGVDFISSGALTKNIHAIDLSLRIID